MYIAMIARKYFKTLIFVEFSVSHHLLLTMKHQKQGIGEKIRIKKKKKKFHGFSYSVARVSTLLCYHYHDLYIKKRRSKYKY